MAATILWQIYWSTVLFFILEISYLHQQNQSTIIFKITAFVY